MTDDILSVGTSKPEDISIEGFNIEGTTLNSRNFSIRKVGVPLSNQ